MADYLDPLLQDELIDYDGGSLSNNYVADDTANTRKRKADDEIPVTENTPTLSNGIVQTAVLAPGVVLPPKKKRGRPPKSSKPKGGGEQDDARAQPVAALPLSQPQPIFPQTIPVPLIGNDYNDLHPVMPNYADYTHGSPMDSYINDEHAFIGDGPLASTSTLPMTLDLASNALAESNTMIADAVHQAILPTAEASANAQQELATAPKKRKGRAAKSTTLTQNDRDRIEKYILDPVTGERLSNDDILAIKHWSAADLRILREHFQIQHESGKRFDKAEEEIIKTCLEKYRIEHDLPVDDTAALKESVFSKPLDLEGFWLPMTRQLRGRAMNTLFLHLGNHLSKRNVTWTPEQDARIVELVNTHGRKWKKISTLLDNIAPADIANHFFTVLNLVDVKNKKTGIFDESELVALANAIEEAKQSLGGMEKRGFWDRVSKSVPSRTPNQCKQKWASMVSQTPGAPTGSPAV